MGRERLDAQAAFERLRGAARSSTRRLADVARDVTDGQPLPANRRTLAKARAGQARQRESGSARQDRSARTLRFDVRFSPFHLVDADGDGDGDPSLGDYPVFHDILLRDRGKFVGGRQPSDEHATPRLRQAKL
jgi:hypothetical protein